ncbi:MAG: hypothetical protein ACOYL8_00135 [Patescibacteria group bacterium]
MDIVINTTGFEQFLNLQSDQIFWAFFANFGWIIIGIVFLIGARDVWLFYIRSKWSRTHKSVLLAIDIPKGNEQSPKAVENMFAYLGGAHGTQNFYEKWFEGIYQKSFSYEIVSLEGYTQFLIRTPVEFRSLIESSVYSQYPDAEISEVDDYTETVPQRYPDEEWDIFGTEFILQNPWYIPIKTYEEFEHKMGPSETQFKDPMASLMDLCGSIRQGEQFWFQMIVIPTGFDWVKEAQKELDKILGRKKKSKPGLLIQGLEFMGDASEAILPIWGDLDPSKVKKDEKRTMLDLTPKEKRQVEAIHLKSIKMSFYTKLRIVYLAKKEVMNKAKVVNGFVGYIKQFMSLDLNSFKPDLKVTMTKTVYFNRESRLNVKKRNIFRNYIHRSDEGREPYLLNIEELATLWHFPVEANVKSPLIQKAPGRKADAPSSLPLAEEKEPLPAEIFSGFNIASEETQESLDKTSDEENASPPPNLPFV